MSQASGVLLVLWVRVSMLVKREEFGADVSIKPRGGADSLRFLSAPHRRGSELRPLLARERATPFISAEAREIPSAYSGEHLVQSAKPIKHYRGFDGRYVLSPLIYSELWVDKTPECRRKSR